MKKPSLLERYLEFITEDIWALNLSTLSFARRLIVRVAKIAYIVIRGFLKDNCPLRASALTYATLLSLVPLLAFAFALASGFKAPMDSLQKLIVDKIALGNEEIGNHIFSFVSNINATKMGLSSLALLIFTVISVIGNIELSFNRIWGVQKARTIWRKFSDYLSVLIVSPLFILVGVGIKGALSSNRVVSFLLNYKIFQTTFWLVLTVLPVVIICLGFGFLYIFMPNTRVKLRAALLGGLVAGLIWQLALWGYLNFQVGFVKYARIYGAMAQIPITLVWIYLSWLIVLFGAEVAFAVQNVRTYQREESALSRSWAYQELVALNILEKIGATFLKGGQFWNAQRLSENLNVPIRLINQLLGKMVGGGLLNEVAGEEHAYQPARDLSQLTVKKVIDSLRNTGGPKSFPPDLKKSPLVVQIEHRLEKVFEEAGVNPTLEELLTGNEKDTWQQGDK